MEAGGLSEGGNVQEIYSEDDFEDTFEDDFEDYETESQTTIDIARQSIPLTEHSVGSVQIGDESCHDLLAAGIREEEIESEECNPITPRIAESLLDIPAHSWAKALAAESEALAAESEADSPAVESSLGECEPLVSPESFPRAFREAAESPEREELKRDHRVSEPRESSVLAESPRVSPRGSLQIESLEGRKESLEGPRRETAASSCFSLRLSPGTSTCSVEFQASEKRASVETAEMSPTMSPRSSFYEIQLSPDCSICSDYLVDLLNVAILKPALDEVQRKSVQGDFRRCPSKMWSKLYANFPVHRPCSAESYGSHGTLAFDLVGHVVLHAVESEDRCGSAELVRSETPLSSGSCDAIMEVGLQMKPGDVQLDVEGGNLQQPPALSDASTGLQESTCPQDCTTILAQPYDNPEVSACAHLVSSATDEALQKPSLCASWREARRYMALGSRANSLDADELRQRVLNAFSSAHELGKLQETLQQLSSYDLEASSDCRPPTSRGRHSLVSSSSLPSFTKSGMGELRDGTVRGVRRAQTRDLMEVVEKRTKTVRRAKSVHMYPGMETVDEDLDFPGPATRAARCDQMHDLLTDAGRTGTLDDVRSTLYANLVSAGQSGDLQRALEALSPDLPDDDVEETSPLYLRHVSFPQVHVLPPECLNEQAFPIDELRESTSQMLSQAATSGSLSNALNTKAVPEDVGTILGSSSSEIANCSPEVETIEGRRAPSRSAPQLQQRGDFRRMAEGIWAGLYAAFRNTPRSPLPCPRSELPSAPVPSFIVNSIRIDDDKVAAACRAGAAVGVSDLMADLLESVAIDNEGSAHPNRCEGTDAQDTGTFISHWFADDGDDESDDTLLLSSSQLSNQVVCAQGAFVKPEVDPNISHESQRLEATVAVEKMEAYAGLHETDQKQCSDEGKWDLSISLLSQTLEDEAQADSHKLELDENHVGTKGSGSDMLDRDVKEKDVQEEANDQDRRNAELFLRLEAKQIIMQVVLKVVCEWNIHHQPKTQERLDLKSISPDVCESKSLLSEPTSIPSEPEETQPLALDSSRPSEMQQIPSNAKNSSRCPSRTSPRSPSTPPLGKSSMAVEVQQSNAKTSSRCPSRTSSKSPSTPPGKEKQPRSRQTQNRGSEASAQSKSSSSRSPPVHSHRNGAEEISKPTGAPRGRPLGLRRGKSTVFEQSESSKTPKSQKINVPETTQMAEEGHTGQRGSGSQSVVSESQCVEADQEGESTIDAIEPEFYEVSDDEFERLMQAGIFQAPCVHPGALSTGDGTFLCDVSDAEFQMLMNTGAFPASVDAVQSRFYDYASLAQTYDQSMPAVQLSQEAFNSIEFNGLSNYGYYTPQGYGCGLNMLDPAVSALYGSNIEYNHGIAANEMQWDTNTASLDEAGSHAMPPSAASLVLSPNAPTTGLTRSAPSSRSGSKNSSPLRDNSRTMRTDAKKDATSPERQERQATKRDRTPPRRKEPQAASEQRKPMHRPKSRKCENLVFFEFSGTLIGTPATTNKKPGTSSSSRAACRSEGQESQEGSPSKLKEAQPELTREHGASLTEKPELSRGDSKNLLDETEDEPNSKRVAEGEGRHRTSSTDSRRTTRQSMESAKASVKSRTSIIDSATAPAPVRKRSSVEDVSKARSSNSRSKRTSAHPEQNGDFLESEKETDDAPVASGANANSATPSKRCSVKPVLPKLTPRGSESLQKDQRAKRALGGRTKDNDIPEESSKTTVAAGIALNSARVLRTHTEGRGECESSSNAALGRPRSHGRGGLETATDSVRPSAPESPRPPTFGPRTPGAPSAQNARPAGWSSSRLTRQAKVAKGVDSGLVFESSIVPGIPPADMKGGGSKRDDARVAKRGQGPRKLKM